ncbi:MAG TPA: alpha/beta fold hydrolase [Gemmatimonadaceae bacterium]|nr:alpha/beta fold hydrolase [Gemmatimonadaceae bacterium]
MTRASVAMVVMVALVMTAIGGVLWVRSFARAFLRVRGRKGAATPSTVGLDASGFSVERPGGMLRGWFLPAARDPRPTLIFAHGWQSHASDMLAYAKPIVEGGFHVVVFDTLGHGESDRTEFASARHFTEDLLAVWRWALARSETAPGIALGGHSLGGTAAILAAVEGEAEGLVPRAIVTVGSPSDPVKGTEEWLTKKGYPGPLMMRAVYPFWQPIIGWERPRLRAVARMPRLTVPLLVIHGAADRQVGPHHARLLAGARPGTGLELLEGADHWTVPTDPRFGALVVQFLREAFGR